MTFSNSHGVPQGRLRSDTGAGRCRPQRATKRVSVRRSQQDAERKPRRTDQRGGQAGLTKTSKGILGWPGHPSEHRGRRISPASIAALRDQGGQVQEMTNGEGSTAACVESPSLWGLSIASLRDMALSAKTGGSSRRQRCRDLNPHGLGRRLPGQESTGYHSSCVSSLFREETEISVALG